MKPITWWTIVQRSPKGKAMTTTFDLVTPIRFPVQSRKGLVFTRKLDAVEFIAMYGHDGMVAVKLSEIVREKS